MASLNRVFLIGNLTKDPEVRYIPSGTAVGDLSMAVTERFKNKEGVPTETVCYIDVVVWARQAETCAEYLRKGSPVMVEGRLQLDKWKTKEGENRSKLRVRADVVQFLGSPRGGAARDGTETDGAAPASGGVAAGVSEEPEGPSGPQPSAGDDDNLPF